MNHWLETSKRNLIPLSQANSFSEALKEWLFTGCVFDYDGEEIECELCEHPDLAHHFEIQNKINTNRLLVGSSCILKFSEINILDSSGKEITNPEERKSHLEDALQKKLAEIMIEPLRKLWLKDKGNRTEIESKAIVLKRGEGISPNQLLSLFLRMDELQIQYTASRYKISLRTYQEQGELTFMSKANLQKLKPALSGPQLKKHSLIFTHEI
jgi:hypothetical protein